MANDYSKSSRKYSSNRSGGSSFFFGLLVGVVLGLSIALGVAWYINKIPSPFKDKNAPPHDTTVGTGKNTEARNNDSQPRFSFPQILKRDTDSNADILDVTRKKAEEPKKEVFFLQAGAFHKAPDADNFKARLALVGIETSIQSTTLPNNEMVHRVRVGPFSDVEEVNRIRSLLKQNGVDAILVKEKSE